MHDYLPHVRDPETKQIWIDHKMNNILCNMCRLPEGQTVIGDDIKEKLKPGSMKYVVAK